MGELLLTLELMGLDLSRRYCLSRSFLHFAEILKKKPIFTEIVHFHNSLFTEND